MTGVQTCALPICFPVTIVSEEGTEAAAATAMIMQQKSLPPQPFTVLVDHPFFWTVFEKQTGISIFSGRVENPA